MRESLFVERAGMRSGRALEEYIADLYRKAGREVTSPATVMGARNKHKVDVWLEFKALGMPQRWVIECRDRKTRVKKEHVIAFRGIVEDIGATVGIIVSTSGFQRGAREAARYTNINLHTPEEVALSLGEARLRSAAAALPAVRAELASLINRLSERHKLVLTLLYFEGLTTEETSAVLGIRRAAVSRILNQVNRHIASAILSPDE